MESLLNFSLGCFAFRMLHDELVLLERDLAWMEQEIQGAERQSSHQQVWPRKDWVNGWVELESGVVEWGCGAATP